MKLHFLGTGGGRFVTGTQKRKTGGMILETNETALHIDPGPGALIGLNANSSYPREKLEGIIVSHSHLDHYNDAEALLEVITQCEKNYCQLMAPESVLKGFSDTEQTITNYHQNMCNKIVQLENDGKTKFQGLEIETQEMFHTDPKCVGFKVSNGEKKWGFWTDTQYGEELVGFYDDCDVIVIYCSRPWKEPYKGHTDLSDVPKILGNSEASTVIITHLGYKFLESDLEKQKTLLQDEIDQKVVFAEDGMTFPGNRSLGDF